MNHGTLEAQRRALFNWINVQRPHGSSRNAITVVFDGKEEYCSAQSVDGIRVIFSKGQSADDVIKNIVQANLKKRIVVVSNDKEIKFYVGALGAQVMSVQEFCGKVPKKTGATSVGKTQDKMSNKYISLAQQAKITKEFEKIWIKSK